MKLEIELSEDTAKATTRYLGGFPAARMNELYKAIAKAYRAQKPSKLDECVEEIEHWWAQHVRSDLFISKDGMRQILSKYIPEDS